MLTNPTNNNWNQLLTSLNISKNTSNEDQIKRLVYWCNKHIKSDYLASSVEAIHIFYNQYTKLNAHSALTDLFDTKLGYTVLHKAAELGWDRFIEERVTKINDLNASKLFVLETKAKNTPLHLAAVRGDLKTIGLLLEYCPDAANKYNDSKKLPIHLAALDNKEDSVRIESIKALLLVTNPTCLESKDSTKRSLLFYLVDCTDLEIITEILKKNPNIITLTDAQGQNILHQAIIHSNEKLFNYLITNHKALISDLTTNSSTSLHLACRYGTEQLIINTLKLNKNAVDELDEHLKTPYEYAVARAELKRVPVRLKPINQSIKLG